MRTHNTREDMLETEVARLRDYVRSLRGALRSVIARVPLDERGYSIKVLRETEI